MKSSHWKNWHHLFCRKVSFLTIPHCQFRGVGQSMKRAYLYLYIIKTWTRQNTKRTSSLREHRSGHHSTEIKTRRHVIGWTPFDKTAIQNTMYFQRKDWKLIFLFLMATFIWPPSYGADISQFLRFSHICNNGFCFIACNLVITGKNTSWIPFP